MGGKSKVKVRTNQLHVLLSDEDEARIKELSSRMGYDRVSDFVRNVLEAMADKYGPEGWSSGMLHLDGEQVVLRPSEGEPFSVYSFPIVAPNRLWKYLDHLDKKEAPSSDGDDGLPPR